MVEGLSQIKGWTLFFKLKNVKLKKYVRIFKKLLN